MFAIAVITAVVLLSCKNSPVTPSFSPQDTAGFAEFRQWKMAEFREWQQMRLDATAANPASQSSAKKATGSTGHSGGYMTSSSSYNAKVVKKKGWSKAAKGAAIGGGSGAVLGALVHKRNRVVGAIVGGIIGGGSGYVIGRSQDKKDGRY